MRVQQQLQKIRNAVYRFQGQLIDVKPSPDLNLIFMITLCSFEELLKEERTSWQEICALERKIHSWSLIVKKDNELPKVKPSLDNKWREKLPLEVTAVEAFLQQTGGKLGGWDQYDHQSFLKVWTKHSGKPSYRTEVKLYLPGKTDQEIRLHEHWYIEFCCLQDKKKESRDQEAEAERKDPKAAATDARRLRQEKERKEAAARLETWRNRRREQQEQVEEQRLREEVLQRKRQNEERRRQLEVKLAVEAHVRQKKEEEELRLLQKEAQERVEMEERKRLAAEGIRRFQERVESHINRDPSRLWKPTKGWQERTKEIGPTGGGPVYQMFHRYGFIHVSLYSRCKYMIASD
uniref:Coiled-coil domain containing 112 n=1 Tax=Electrophorus electricus TaxID=8005 RepID=A0A4W4EU11_ELEEL